MAFLSYQWRDGVFTLRIELWKPAVKTRVPKLGPHPLPPPFPLPPPMPIARSWLDVEPTTVGVLDPAQTLDAPDETLPLESDRELEHQRRWARRALKDSLSQR